MNNYLFKNPELSVILSVYNGQNYISEAIDSILTQTFTDFELILINDGSNDATPTIINSYSDSRIVYIQNEKNIGIPKSLNKGLKIARGRYIAIMDADDISLPDRFLKQFTFLENNPEVAVCGTWINIIDKNGNLVDNWIYPISSNVISFCLMFYCCIANPTTMYRKKITQKIGDYNPEFIAAMDYDLWIRANEHYTISNLPEFLLNYRIHGENISQNREKHCHEDYRIRKKGIELLLGHSLTSEEDIALCEWIRPKSEVHLKNIFLIDDLILKIYKRFLRNKKMSKAELQEIDLFFANQTFNLAWLSKSISNIGCIKFIFRAFRYPPGIFVLMFKKLFLARIPKIH
jgi:glycosyltransferase involved in cell wall biosynthesis